jgi:hypothetical protein
MSQITRTDLAQIQGSSRGLVLRTMDDYMTLARAAVSAGFGDKSIDTPQKALIVLQYGAELGLQPLQSLQGVYVVNNKPSVYGDTFLALLQGKPAWDEATFEEELVGKPYEDDYCARCTMGRKLDDGKVKRKTVEFSVDDAKRAGLWNKKTRSGSPTPWVTSPKRMLMMRARTFCGRDLFADILRGMTTYEEAMDYIDVEPEERAPKISRTEQLVNDVIPDARPAQPAEEESLSSDTTPLDSAPPAESSGESPPPPSDDPEQKAELLAELKKVLPKKTQDKYRVICNAFKLEDLTMKTLGALPTAQLERIRNALPSGAEKLELADGE